MTRLTGRAACSAAPTDPLPPSAIFVTGTWIRDDKPSCHGQLRHLRYPGIPTWRRLLSLDLAAGRLRDLAAQARKTLMPMALLQHVPIALLRPHPCGDEILKDSPYAMPVACSSSCMAWYDHCHSRPTLSRSATGVVGMLCPWALLPLGPRRLPPARIRFSKRQQLHRIRAML